MPTIHWDYFKNVVKNGDLFLTQATNNVLSKLHNTYLHAPATHVAIILKSNNIIYLYEGAAKKGTQIRNLENYLIESKCKYLFWRQMYVSENDLQKQILHYANKAYNYNYLKYILFKMTNIYFLYYFFTFYDSLKSKLFPYLFAEGYSCSTLVATILKNLNAINPTVKLESIFPSDFLSTNDTLLNPTKLSKTIRVLY